jgi:hypothetical protein
VTSATLSRSAAPRRSFRRPRRRVGAAAARVVARCYISTQNMIRLAHELSFSPPPRCPHPGCGTGLLAYGRDEPFAVDAQGRPYCRVHGVVIEPTYPERLAAYTTALKARRSAAMADLDAATLEHHAEE